MRPAGPSRTFADSKLQSLWLSWQCFSTIIDVISTNGTANLVACMCRAGCRQNTVTCYLPTRGILVVTVLIQSKVRLADGVTTYDTAPVRAQLAATPILFSETDPTTLANAHNNTRLSTYTT
ncbi:unnamed protein product [Phytophthora fragariaefolia]|uniref:Unnamed protein product n=1 Tax=Phytophthora fragariaefolia TaxID=1490495 RepID=A0A9W6YCI3_9STRA|nr:unnamed protein product [Phytophthora fragariaefolia]